MKMQCKRTAVMLAALALTVAGARANNLAVKNVSVEPIDDATATIEFDVSWKNAWRYDNINHDAVWMFFKVLPGGDTQNAWQHAILERGGHETGSGTGIEIIVPEDRLGLFVRKAGEGTGDVDVTGVKAVWNFAANGLAKQDTMQVRALGIEMVYVPEGAFSVGSGGTGSGELYEGGGGTNPFVIANAGPIEFGDEAGKLWGASLSGHNSMGGPGILSGNFPNGYAAFYCMKYPVTQGLYANFLNTLTEMQARNRYPGKNGNYRHTISGSLATGYSATAPDRACNYLSWADGAAFADGSGLRPMTELEYEKACRGPLMPVADEYAWGSRNITAQTGHSGEDGSGAETATPSGANSNYDNKLGGPVRVGIYATAASSREAAGASYWGIMGLSGNLRERAVTIGNTTGRGYTGLHGDGVLTGAGAADVANWPGTDASGAGFRGGDWVDTSVAARVSDRRAAALVRVGRYGSRGWRGVRAAPSGLPNAPRFAAQAEGEP